MSREARYAVYSPHESGDTRGGSILLTIDEVAAKLRVSPGTVRNMRRDGRIPQPIELSGNHIRWSAKVIDTWIEAGCPEVFLMNEEDEV